MQTVVLCVCVCVVVCVCGLAGWGLGRAGKSHAVLTARPLPSAIDVIVSLMLIAAPTTTADPAGG